MPSQRSATILGVRVDLVNWTELLSACRSYLGTDQVHQIATVNGEFILEAQTNQPFNQALSGSDLAICDSTNVAWAIRRRGEHNFEITAGSDLTLKLCELAQEMGQSVYLLGGRGEVAKLSADKLVENYPQLKIAGYSAKNPDDDSILEDLAKSKADILLVGYGAPKQDIWVAQHKSKLKVKIAVGIGGTFDMLSGRKPRAPKFIRQIHFEWLWRVILEPSRISRTLRATIVFPLRVLFG